MKFRQTRSKYDLHAPQLVEWLEVENISVREAARRLNKIHPQLKAEDTGLCRWWSKVLKARNMGRWSDAISNAASYCRKVEGDFAKNPPPMLDMLIEMHRAIIMNEVMKKGDEKEALKVITEHVKPAMQWAQMKERGKSRALAENKFKESLRTKMEAGFDAMAEHIKDNPAAMTALENFRKVLAGTAK